MYWKLNMDIYSIVWTSVCMHSLNRWVSLRFSENSLSFSLYIALLKKFYGAILTEIEFNFTESQRLSLIQVQSVDIHTNPWRPHGYPHVFFDLDWHYNVLSVIRGRSTIISDFRSHKIQPTFFSKRNPHSPKKGLKMKLYKVRAALKWQGTSKNAIFSIWEEVCFQCKLNTTKG